MAMLGHKADHHPPTRNMDVNEGMAMAMATLGHKRGHHISIADRLRII
jgi:hypothetical protein